MTVIPPNVVERKIQQEILLQEAEEARKAREAKEGGKPTPLFGSRKKSIKDFATMDGQEDLTI